MRQTTSICVIARPFIGFCVGCGVRLATLWYDGACPPPGQTVFMHEGDVVAVYCWRHTRSCHLCLILQREFWQSSPLQGLIVHKNCPELPYSTANPRFCVTLFQQLSAMSRCSMRRNGIAMNCSNWGPACFPLKNVWLSEIGRSGLIDSICLINSLNFQMCDYDL